MEAPLCPGEGCTLVLRPGRVSTSGCCAHLWLHWTVSISIQVIYLLAELEQGHWPRQSQATMQAPSVLQALFFLRKGVCVCVCVLGGGYLHMFIF